MDERLRPWQRDGLHQAVEAASVPRTRRAFVAPTGAGKGTAMLAIAEALRDRSHVVAITTPSGEIVRGLLDRLGAVAPGAELSGEALWKLAEARGVYSPVRLRNRLAAGAIPVPSVILVDENHHASEASASVWERIAGELAPEAVFLGFTATPYRGSQAETAALRAWWGEPQVLLSIADAARDGWLAVPSPETWPLFDDSGVRVIAGEFDDADAEAEAERQEVAERLVARLTESGWCASGHWARPTLIAGPTVRWCQALAGRLSAAGLPAEAISGDVSRIERDRLLSRCCAGAIALVQVKVLAEGVDMPWLRRLVDVRPLRSPVAWMQLLGRITRPTTADELPPEYACVTRNLGRHAYLLSGAWPAVQVSIDAEGAFNGAGGGHAGATALERGVAKDALGKRHRFDVPLLGGGIAQGIFLSKAAGWDGEDHLLAIGIPGEAEPRVWARRNGRDSAGSRTWGRWAAATIDPAGYAGWTAPKWTSGALTERQSAWWAREAATVGLDPSTAGIDAGTFPVLPALIDSGTRLPTAKPRPVPAPVASTVVPEPLTVSEPLVVSEPRERSATWARLRSGSWGGRVGGRDAESVSPGQMLVLRARDGREERRVVTAVEARGADWALCAVSEAPPLSAQAAPSMPAVAPESGPQVAPGRYALPGADGTRFYRADRGQLYRLTGSPGALRETPMSSGAARLALAAIVADSDAGPRFGREIGLCGRCGSPLTNPVSRASGYGPECITMIGARS